MKQEEKLRNSVYDAEKLKKQLEGIVIGNFLTAAEIDGVKGLLHPDGGTLFFHTAAGIKQWPVDQLPDELDRALWLDEVWGVPYVEGSIKDLLGYMQVAGKGVDADLRVVTAMLMPILVGDGSAGFIFLGPPASGKSFFAKALGYLEGGLDWATPVGSQVKDHVVTLSANRIAYFDDAGFLRGEFLRGNLLGLLLAKLDHEIPEIKNPRTASLLKGAFFGSVIVCATPFDNLPPALVTRSIVIPFRRLRVMDSESGLIEFFRQECHKARGGLIELWLESQKVAPPSVIPPHVRYVDWFKSAYRASVVLGVEKEFLAYV